MAPGKIEVPLNSTRVDLLMTYKDFEFQFKAQDYERGVPLATLAVTNRNIEADNCYIAQAIYRKAVNEKLFLSFKGNYYYHKSHHYGEAYPKEMFGPLVAGIGAQGFFSDGFLWDMVIEDRQFGFQSQLDYSLNNNNTLTFGAEYGNMQTPRPVLLVNMDPETRMQSNDMHGLSGAAVGLMERDADRSVFAFFVQDSWKIRDSLNFFAGLRIDTYSGFGSAINPRLSLVYKVHKNTNIKLLYGHAFRAPTFSELYSIAIVQVGNENLGPEKVRSFEIGINHKLSPKINMGINYFYNSLTDIIVPTGDILVQGYPPQLMNSGKANAQGIEVETKANFKKNTYAYFNYSYARAKDELTGEVFPDVANNLFNFGLNVSMWEYLKPQC